MQLLPLGRRGTRHGPTLDRDPEKTCNLGPIDAAIGQRRSQDQRLHRLAHVRRIACGQWQPSFVCPGLRPGNALPRRPAAGRRPDRRELETRPHGELSSRAPPMRPVPAASRPETIACTRCGRSGPAAPGSRRSCARSHVLDGPSGNRSREDLSARLDSAKWQQRNQARATQSTSIRQIP